MVSNLINLFIDLTPPTIVFDLMHFGHSRLRDQPWPTHMSNLIEPYIEPGHYCIVPGQFMCRLLFRLQSNYETTYVLTHV